MEVRKVMKVKTQSEDEYFYLLNRELIAKQRAYLDQVRKNKESLLQQKLHWMKCPKCGYQLEEHELSGVMIDQCDSCKGVYLDKGEIDLLISAQKPESFLKKLKVFFAKDPTSRVI